MAASVSVHNKRFWATCRIITTVAPLVSGLPMTDKASHFSSRAFVVALAGITTHLSKMLPFRLTKLPARPHFLCYAASASKAGVWCQLFLLETYESFTGPQLLDSLQDLIPEIINWDKNNCRIHAVARKDVLHVINHAHSPATPFCLAIQSDESSEDDQSEDLGESSDISEEDTDDLDFIPSHDESSDSEFDSVDSSSEEEEETDEGESNDTLWGDTTILLFQVDDFVKETVLKASQEMAQLRSELLDPTADKPSIFKREFERVRDKGYHPSWRGSLLAWRQGNLLALAQEIWRGFHPEWLRDLIATHLPHPQGLMTYARFCRRFPLTPTCRWDWDDFVKKIPGLIDYFKEYPLEAQIWQGQGILLRI